MRIRAYRPIGYCPDPVTRGPLQFVESGAGPVALRRDIFDVKGEVYIFARHRDVRLVDREDGTKRSVALDLVLCTKMSAHGASEIGPVEAAALLEEFEKRWPLLEAPIPPEEPAPEPLPAAAPPPRARRRAVTTPPAVEEPATDADPEPTSAA